MMTQVRDRTINNRMTPATPALYLYDETGNQTIAQPAAGTILTFDTCVVKTSHFDFTEGMDRITLLSDSAGWFLLTFDCSFYSNVDEGVSDAIGYVAVYKNGALLPQSISYFSVYYNTTAQVSYPTYSGIKLLVYLEKGDYLHIKGRSLVGLGCTHAQTQRLTLTFLPMKGWDNSMAGRIEYTGGVER